MTDSKTPRGGNKESTRGIGKKSGRTTTVVPASVKRPTNQGVGGLPPKKTPAPKP